MSSWHAGYGYGGGGQSSSSGVGRPNANDAHMGPIPLKGSSGTLTSEDRARIFEATHCSASVRWRQQWGQRCLSITGPPEYMTEAKRLADEAIQKNGTEGGRKEDQLETLKQENLVLKARMTAMELSHGQLVTLAQNAMKTACENRQALMVLQNDMLGKAARKQKKHKKNHTHETDEEEDVKEQKFRPIPAKVEEQDSDTPGEVNEEKMEKRKDRTKDERKEVHGNDESDHKDGTSDATEHHATSEDEQMRLSPTSVSCLLKVLCVDGKKVK